jgi:hypothetical protein
VVETILKAQDADDSVEVPSAKRGTLRVSSPGVNTYSYVNYNADGTGTFKYPEIVRAIRHAAQGDAGE